MVTRRYDMYISFGHTPVHNTSLLSQVDQFHNRRKATLFVNSSDFSGGSKYLGGLSNSARVYFKQVESSPTAKTTFL